MINLQINVQGLILHKQLCYGFKSNIPFIGEPFHRQQMSLYAQISSTDRLGNSVIKIIYASFFQEKLYTVEKVIVDITLKLKECVKLHHNRNGIAILYSKMINR